MNTIKLLLPQNTNDLLLAFGLFAALSLFLVFSELVHRLFHVNEDYIRKVIHMVTGVFIVIAAIYLPNPFPIVVIAFFFAVFNFFTIKTGIIKGLSSRKESLGTVFYPLAVLLLIVFFWQDYKILFVLPVLILAVADAFAAIVGENIRNPHTFRIWGDKKSFEGSLSMLIITFFMLYVGIFIYVDSRIIPQPLFQIWFVALITAVYVTVSEMIAVKGSDNINVAVIAALSLKILLFDPAPAQYNFLWAHVYAILAALISHRLKFLNASGAITAYFIAVIIQGLGGYSWTIPILVFFVLSSLLTRMGKNHKRILEDIFEKGGRRDAQQVLANGGLATIWVIIYFLTDLDILYPMYLATLAAATADTWGTEVGVFSKSARLITTFKRVEKGRSGGVSVIGTSGAFIGSVVLSCSGLPFIREFTNGSELDVSMIILIVGLAGFTGSLIDSLIGATVQAQYVCTKCSKITEKMIHCGLESGLERGFPVINNDLVNFVATASSALLIILADQSIGL